LLVVIGIRSAIGEEAFADWGWRLPFLVSILLSPSPCGSASSSPKAPSSRR
jgi:hypothetical protein